MLQGSHQKRTGFSAPGSAPVECLFVGQAQKERLAVGGFLWRVGRALRLQIQQIIQLSLLLAAEFGEIRALYLLDYCEIYHRSYTKMVKKAA